MGDVIAQGAMPYIKIFDMLGATALVGAKRLADVGATVRLYDKMELGKIGPLAIVGASDKSLVQAMAFLDAATARRPVRLFSTNEDACAWLRTAPACRD